MNRAERRKFMKKHPEYRKAVKKNAKKAVAGLEEAFKERWAKNNELEQKDNNNRD